MFKDTMLGELETIRKSVEEIKTQLAQLAETIKK
jgi:hypothetical protein